MATRGKQNVKIIFPSTITSFSMIFGFVAILFACDDQIAKACYLLLLSTVLDGLDGKVARMTNTASEFGIQYDSLADLVAFGVAPSVIYYRFYIYERITDPLYMLLPIMYMVCGAIRLARFNITASIFGKAYFTGLPIPAAACCLVVWPPLSMYTARSEIMQNLGLHELLSKENFFVFSIFLIVLLSLSMISTMRFDTLSKFWLRKFKYKPLNYIVILAFLPLLYFHFALYMAAICSYYLISMYVRALIDRIRKNEQFIIGDETEP